MIISLFSFGNLYKHTYTRTHSGLAMLRASKPQRQAQAMG